MATARVSVFGRRRLESFDYFESSRLAELRRVASCHVHRCIEACLPESFPFLWTLRAVCTFPTSNKCRLPRTTTTTYSYNV